MTTHPDIELVARALYAHDPDYSYSRERNLTWEETRNETRENMREIARISGKAWLDILMEPSEEALMRAARLWDTDLADDESPLSDGVKKVRMLEALRDSKELILDYLAAKRSELRL